MLRRSWLFAFLFLAVTLSSPAQQMDASNTGGPTPLDAPWRLHFGDDPSYAQPSVDDSHWTLHRIDKDWASAGYKGYAGYAWYRMHVILPRGNEPLAIAIYPPANAIEVYIDGTLAGTIGRIRPEPVFTRRRTSYAIPVPAALNGSSVEVALRAWESPLSAPYLGAGAAAHPPLLGTASDIDSIVSLEQQKRWLAQIPQWAVDLLGFAVGLFSFGLFVLQRQAREYAYAALYLCGSAVINQYSWMTSQLGYSVGLTAEVAFIAHSFLLCLWLLITWGFVRARADRFLYACLAAAWISAVGSTAVTVGAISVAQAFWSLAAMYLFLSIAVFVCLYPLARRGNRDAQLFLIPFFLTMGAACVLEAVGALIYSGVVSLSSHMILYHNPHFNCAFGMALAWRACAIRQSISP